MVYSTLAQYTSGPYATASSLGTHCIWSCSIAEYKSVARILQQMVHGASRTQKCLRSCSFTFGFALCSQETRFYYNGRLPAEIQDQ
uniref:Uncharacterized protein n=1 Tax=Hyaloperonospora arabidopsidis (strain Emoy2) TaxID=559515 RepID=M4B4A2_HYAAE